MFKRVRTKLRGYKTLAFNALIGGSASVGMLLQEMKEIDLTPWFGDSAPKILVGIAIVGICLRLTSNSPAGGGRRARRREQEPTGYDALDDEDDGPRRDNANTRASRRQGRSNS